MNFDHPRNGGSPRYYDHPWDGNTPRTCLATFYVRYCIASNNVGIVNKMSRMLTGKDRQADKPRY